MSTRDGSLAALTEEIREALPELRQQAMVFYCEREDGTVEDITWGELMQVSRTSDRAARLLSAALAHLEGARALIGKWEDAAVWEHDDMGNTQSAQTFDQCANDLRAALAGRER